MFVMPEKYRVVHPWAGMGDSGNGAFELPMGRKKFRVMASSGGGWEHVSVSLPDRCPTWDEMCAIKEVFWGPDEWVVQFHPSRANYVDLHPNCLHMWRPRKQDLPIPPTWMV